jgi:uncharacterized membrane protein YbhN (UPF0104 family)
MRRTERIAQAFRGKAAYHRIGVAISLVLIAAASVALYHLLRDIQIEKVAEALRATSIRAMLAAGCFVAAGYLTLTCYDFFALRTIGRRDVPYRIAALASFTSYSIGHNLGATAVTGGMVRYRIYSAYGLSIVDVAKIAFVTGLTFWLGNAFVLGVGIAYAPEAASAVTQLPAWLNRLVACAGLASMLGYLAWLLPCPRIIGRDHWQVTLPSAPLTLVQIGIGVLDLTSVALAMYMLLPTQPPIEFIPLLVTFVMATLLGFVSHTPGSLGVFDAAMLVGLPQFEKEGLVAAVLMFRFLYFVIPLSLAITALAIRELRLAALPKAPVASRDDAGDPPP